MNIVLAHGILGSDRLFGLEYFKGVRNLLEQEFHANVLLAKVDPIAGIEERGMELKERITSAHQAGGRLDPSQKIHLIAHSMGGLDARFLLSPGNPQNIADRVASLTTIGTPHQGSPVADALFSPVDGKALLKIFRLTEHQLRSLIGAVLSLDGLRDLTTEATRQFNVKFPDHSDVRYFSIAGTGPDSILAWTGSPFLATHLGLQHLPDGGDNDGVVTKASASRWKLTEVWSADHLEQIGHHLSLIPGSFDHLNAYRQLAKRLAAL